MRWFRSHRLKVAWLALFALTCQFVFTFGHVHPVNIDAVSAAISTDAPTRNSPTGLARDICAICNNISLANALVLPLPPATVPPDAFVSDSRWQLVVTQFVSRDHFHFDARGPPQT